MKYRLYLVLLIVYLFGGCYDSTNVPIAKKGVIDLRNWSFEHNKNIELNGEWKFYWNQLLNPEDFKSDSTITRDAEYAIVPDIWTTREVNSKPSKGYATYRLSALLKNEERLYGIKLIDCGTAYELFINDSLVAKNGMISKNADSAQAQYIPLIKSFYAAKDSGEYISVNLLLRCSNYHHSKAGLWEPIKIGLYEDIFKEWKLNYSYYIILTAIIFTIFTLHLLLFALRKSEKEYLYFGIFSMMIFIRNLTVNMRVMFEWFPDFNYEIYEKIEYFSAYGTPMAIGLFFYYSLKEDFHKAVIRGILIYGAIVFLCILILPVYYYSQLKIPFNLYILLTGFYIVFYLVPTAMIRKRKYSQLLFLGVLNLFIAAIFDIFRSSQVIHFFYLTPLSVVIYMCIQSIILAKKFTHIHYQNEKLVVKLDFQNRNLEKIVEKRNAEVIEKNKQLEKLVEAKEKLLQVQDENAQLKQEELKRDLEIKEKELTTHTMLMVQKQNLLDGFVDKLNLIKKNLGKENTTDLNGLEKQLKNMVKVEDTWKDFITSFEQVHTDFFNQLQVKYPDLTPNELKLCALTKLNLNIKETASLLNISPNSVKVARYRLKKRMGLSQDQSLSTFFANLI